jgi:hypothetical protein
MRGMAAISSTLSKRFMQKGMARSLSRRSSSAEIAAQSVALVAAVADVSVGAGDLLLVEVSMVRGVL